jgi:integrase/recombinase XerD
VIGVCEHDARQVLEEWLAVRAGAPADPIFPTRTGARLSRMQLFKALQRVADQANTHRKDGERLTVSPHVLRHTFLRKLAEEKGVQYAKEASGHRSDRYIWRYVKPNHDSLADAIDSLD